MIRFLFRFIGLLVLALAFILVIHDGIKSIADSTFYLSKVNQLWIEIHASSLQALQTLIERNARPELWQWGLQPILRQPAAAVFGVLGILLILLGRKKRPLIGYARD
jgi:hypothetical protein